MSLHHYDLFGQPISFERWCELFEDFDGRRVAYTELGGYRVSTVWLGLDHRFLGEGPPLIFETMVFGPDGAEDLDCHRYATKEEAQAGHDELVTLIRATVQTAEDVLGHGLDDDAERAR